MKTAIKAPFLSDQDRSQVQTILDKHGLSGFDASIRLWGRGKAIDVKGTLGRQELCCLLAIARFLGESADVPANEDMPGASTADTIVAMRSNTAAISPVKQFAAG